MFILKKNYFLIIENTKDIDLNDIKLYRKFNIIYRNNNKKENFNKLLEFRSKCKSKKIKFFISNNLKLMTDTNADGIYVSSYNHNLNFNRLKKTKYEIIGSAHNIKELNIKILQGCTNILFSRLFKTIYSNKKSYLGIVKFNLFKLNMSENLVPLGGIRMANLNKLNFVNCSSLAILSEVKKKPAKIFSRLF